MRPPAVAKEQIFAGDVGILIRWIKQGDIVSVEKGWVADSRTQLDQPFRVEDTSSNSVRDLSPLALAAHYDQPPIVGMLMAHKASVDYPQAGHPDSPLLVACAAGHLNCVHLLLTNGARLDSDWPGGRMPGKVARENGHEAVAQIVYKAARDRQADALLAPPPSAEAEPDAMALFAAATALPSEVVATAPAAAEAVSKEGVEEQTRAAIEAGDLPELKRCLALLSELGTAHAALAKVARACPNSFGLKSF